MTTNQLTYMQLQEQMRANKANEAIRERSNELTELTAIPTAAKLQAEAEALNAKLPYELQLSAEKIKQVAAEAERTITDDIAKRMSIGDATATPMKAERYAGMHQRWSDAWDEMSTGDKVYAIESGLRDAFDRISGIASGSGGSLVGQLVKLSTLGS